jgi:hypothetical protein
MKATGIKASELIKNLQDLIKEKGDLEVFSGGNDFPTGVSHAFHVKDDRDVYVPKDSFYIRCKPY